ncbi:MAG: class I SAM-dependent methyltransferase [Gammaproteobacteria bacterium]|nr:class I SAM-dependent methyltransferase [Gammaproteobacteria bacterium]
MKDWLLECDTCSFLGSTLPPGAGVSVDGLDTLRRDNFARILDQLSLYLSLQGAGILEIGSAKGLFLDMARERGARVTGLEPDALAAGQCRARGHEVIHGFFPDAIGSERCFDVIALNDVFEHLPDPPGAARSLEALLTPGGILCINLPSRDGIFFRLASMLDRIGVHGPFDRLWQRGLPSPHLSYFNQRTLESLMTRVTALQVLPPMSLPSIARSGLRERLASVRTGVPLTLCHPFVWALTWIIDWLPSDIIVGIYRKPER